MLLCQYPHSVCLLAECFPPSPDMLRAELGSVAVRYVFLSERLHTPCFDKTVNPRRALDAYSLELRPEVAPPLS